MIIPKLDFSELKPIPNLNKCVCSSDDISIAELYTFDIRNYAIIRCQKCNREIKRRTYKQAEKAWNKNNPIGGAE